MITYKVNFIDSPIVSITFTEKAKKKPWGPAASSAKTTEAFTTRHVGFPATGFVFYGRPHLPTSYATLTDPLGDQKPLSFASGQDA